MKRIFLGIITMLAALVSVDAKVQPASLFADNMVLQQQSDAAIWGKARPDSKVVITPSWSRKKVVVRSDADGKWFTRVSTPSAGGPYELSFDDGEKTVLKNVLVGEVWICSGQSNMAMPMKGYLGQPVEESARHIMTARPSVPIRSCLISRKPSVEAEYSSDAVWYEHNPEGVAESSAVAYFFARTVHDALDVPIGIINVTYGDSPIEAWMDPDILRSEFAGEFDLSHLDVKALPEDKPYKLPGVLYYGMIRPVAQYTAKGFLWYQGCSNRKRFELYRYLQPAFVKMLRRDWENDKMPFYFVQIAPYKASGADKARGGLMMWSQAQSLENIPYSGMVTTHDVGDFYCVHPPKKRVVGERLAYLALSNDYGVSVVDVKAPLPVKFEFKEGEAVVTFNNCENRGIGPIFRDLEGFELAGEDRVFHPAVAQVIINMERNQISVKSPSVSAPVAVRYGMKNWSVPTLFNNSGIPVSPFRSDDWPYQSSSQSAR